jgi:hypothetical protein
MGIARFLQSLVKNRCNVLVGTPKLDEPGGRTSVLAKVHPAYYGAESRTTCALVEYIPYSIELSVRLIAALDVPAGLAFVVG